MAEVTTLPGTQASWSWGAGDGDCMTAALQLPITIVTSVAKIVGSKQYRREYNERRKAAWDAYHAR